MEERTQQHANSSLLIGKQNDARQWLLTSSHSVQCASISREELKAVPLQVKESGATEEKLEDHAWDLLIWQCTKSMLIAKSIMICNDSKIMYNIYISIL